MSPLRLKPWGKRVILLFRRRGLHNLAMRPSIEAVKIAQPVICIRQTDVPSPVRWMRGKVSVQGWCIYNDQFCADIEIWNRTVLVAGIKFLWLLNLTERLVISLFQVLHRWILALQSLINAYLSTPHSFLVTLIASLRAILNHHRSPRSHFWRHNRRNQQCLGVHPRWPTKPSRPVVPPLWYGVSALMVNGTKSIPPVVQPALPQPSLGGIWSWEC